MIFTNIIRKIKYLIEVHVECDIFFYELKIKQHYTFLRDANLPNKTILD